MITMKWSDLILQLVLFLECFSVGMSFVIGARYNHKHLCDIAMGTPNVGKPALQNKRRKNAQKPPEKHPYIVHRWPFHLSLGEHVFKVLCNWNKLLAVIGRCAPWHRNAEAQSAPPLLWCISPSLSGWIMWETKKKKANEKIYNYYLAVRSLPLIQACLQRTEDTEQALKASPDRRGFKLAQLFKSPVIASSISLPPLQSSVLLPSALSAQMHTQETRHSTQNSQNYGSTLPALCPSKCPVSLSPYARSRSNDVTLTRLKQQRPPVGATNSVSTKNTTRPSATDNKTSQTITLK